MLAWRKIRPLNLAISIAGSTASILHSSAWASNFPPLSTSGTYRFCHTHIDTLVKYVSKKRCREEEYKYLDKYFTEAKSTVHPQTQQKLLKIYNRIFHQKMNLTSCSSCFKNNLHKKLERVYKEYNNE